MTEPDIRADIEIRLRRILDFYSQARTPGDFRDTALGIHAALEDALNLELAAEELPETFNWKVQQRYPDLHEYFNMRQLEWLRDRIENARGELTEKEVRFAAHEFVDFALAVWPDLFNSQPPVILHPGAPEAPAQAASPLPPPPPLIFGDEPERPEPDYLGTPAPHPFAEPLPPAGGATPQDLRAAIAPPARRLPIWLDELVHLPWHHLLYSFASAWMAVMAIGLMVQITDTASTATLLAFGLAMLIFAIATLGYLLHFLIRFGVRRLFIVALALLVLSTVYFTARQPAGTEFSTRFVDGFGRALTAPLFWGGQLGRLAFESGQEFGERYFPESRPMAGDEEEQRQDENFFDRSMQTLFPPTPPPDGQLPTLEVVQPRPGGIYAGGQVQVDADGSRLRGRDAPGLDSTVITMFEPGEVLRVLDGPVEVDGYTWWRVQLGDRSGWSAADFLLPVE